MGGVARSGQLSLLRGPWIRYGQVSVAPVGQRERPSGRQFSSSLFARNLLLELSPPPAPALDVCCGDIRTDFNHKHGDEPPRN